MLSHTFLVAAVIVHRVRNEGLKDTVIEGDAGGSLFSECLEGGSAIYFDDL